jgi:hypothetical protein
MIMAILFFLLDIEPFPFLMSLGAPPVPVRLPDRGSSGSSTHWRRPIALLDPYLPHAWDDPLGHCGSSGAHIANSTHDHTITRNRQVCSRR